jgi:hypothetical protein
MRRKHGPIARPSNGRVKRLVNAQSPNHQARVGDRVGLTVVEVTTMHELPARGPEVSKKWSVSVSQSMETGPKPKPLHSSRIRQVRCGESVFTGQGDRQSGHLNRNSFVTAHNQLTGTKSLETRHELLCKATVCKDEGGCQVRAKSGHSIWMAASGISTRQSRDSLDHMST